MPNHKANLNSMLGFKIIFDYFEDVSMSARSRFVLILARKDRQALTICLVFETLKTNSQHILDNRIRIHFAKSLQILDSWITTARVVAKQDNIRTEL